MMDSGRGGASSHRSSMRFPASGTRATRMPTIISRDDFRCWVVFSFFCGVIFGGRVDFFSKGISPTAGFGRFRTCRATSSWHSLCS